jgi:hypothetical protein
MADDGRGHTRLGPAPVLVTLLLIAAYPLSIGPMAWLVAAGYVAFDNPFWTMFYTPLVWATETVPACEEWLYAYLDFWGCYP